MLPEIESRREVSVAMKDNHSEPIGFMIVNDSCPEFMAVSPITRRFGTAVRKLRHGLELTQEALGERAELHRTYIAEIETGARNITLKSMERLARALEVSPAALLMQAEPPAVQAQPAGCESSASEHVDILFVEHNRDDAESTLRSFKQARVANSVRIVHDGQEALDFLSCTGRFASRKLEDRPDLILLDLDLPRMGGVGVLRRIKGDKRTVSIPVVMLTASRDSHAMGECWRLGAETYIVRPLDFQTLSQAAARLNLDWALLKFSKAKSSNGLGSFSV
jgi:CheY-like chemotaxis protein